MVGSYDSLGRRPSSGVPLGRPGEGEEDLRGYTGLRVVDHTIMIGPNLTDTAAQFVCNNAAIGATGTIPRNLTKVTAISTGLPRTSIPIAMALCANLTAAAAPAGTHSVTVRVLGTNQFGAPVQEDFLLSVAAGGTTADSLGSKIFQTISSVQVVKEENTAAGDDVTVFYSVALNAKFGIPIRIASKDDIVSAVLVVQPIAGNGLLIPSDLIQLGNAITVDLGNQSVLFGTTLVDALVTWITMRIRTSIGMDQGFQRPPGDKYQKAW